MNFLLAFGLLASLLLTLPGCASGKVISVAKGPVELEAPAVSAPEGGPGADDSPVAEVTPSPTPELPTAETLPPSQTIGQPSANSPALSASAINPPAEWAAQELARRGLVRDPSKKMVVLDPGHGGPDVGAAAGSLAEKAVNLGIALKLKGLLEADGFQALRALLAPGARFNLERYHSERRKLRRGARGAFTSEGRWALLPEAGAAGDADELAEAVAEQLLARWGVLFRDLYAHESIALPWRDLVWALRRLEARGLVRGGRFVSGFVGEQYALPEAVEQLRAVRKSERSGEIVRVSACDPLNLVGTIVPGPRISAVRTNVVVYCDGLPVQQETVDRGAQQANTESEKLDASQP